MKTNHIESGNYIGYYWKSDANAPQLLPGVPFDEILDEAANPFIIEAQLFNPETHVSYSIKYVDGRYLIHRWDLTQDFLTQDFEFDDKEYQAHPRLGSQVMMFRQYWKAVVDPQCLDMKVLQPHALVFVGFKEQKEAKS